MHMHLTSLRAVVEQERRCKVQERDGGKERSGVVLQNGMLGASHGAKL